MRHIDRKRFPLLANSKRWYLALGLAGILIAGLGFRLLFLTPFPSDPDEAEYVSIARNLAHDKGLTLSIKLHFFDQQPAEHSAFGERPIFYPLVLSFVLRASQSLPAGKLLNIVIGMAACLIFYLLAATLMPRGWAIVGSAIFFLNPILIESSRTLMSDTLYTFLLLASLLVALRARSLWHYVGLGVLIGLAHLTRQEGILILFAALVWLAWGREWKNAGIVLLASIITFLPYYVLNTLVNGSPFYSTQAYHFRVKSFPGEGMTDPFRQPLPSQLDFIRENWKWLVVQVPYRGIQIFDDLLSRRFLNVLAPFALLGLLLPANERERRVLFLLFLNALLQFVVPVMIWASPYRPEYLLPAYSLLLLLAMRGLWVISTKLPASVKIIATTLLAVVLAMYLLVSANALLNPKPPLLARFDDPQFVQLSQRIAASSQPFTTVATTDPWTLNVLVDRPALLLPEDTISKPEKLDKYIALYHPDYLLIPKAAFATIPLGYRTAISAPLDGWVLLERNTLPPLAR